MDAITTITKIRLGEPVRPGFSDWQADFHSEIVKFKGFVSLEIIAPKDPESLEWTIIQEFDNQVHYDAWLDSNAHKKLDECLKTQFLNSGHLIESKGSQKTWGVTEIFVTKVSPNKTNDYRSWIGKIHKAEANFPGFRGLLVKSPTPGQGEHWITLLHFDSQNNLDKWLNSKERQSVLKEARPLIKSLESHRIISPFAGWFATASVDGMAPPVWKQTCLILLVLFPIVMLEMIFLWPLTRSLNPSVGTFIGNAISVTLVSWPMMPIAIYFLRWWISPLASMRATIKGTAVVMCMYLIEIILFAIIFY